MPRKIFVVSDARIELDEFIQQDVKGFLQITGVLTSLQEIQLDESHIINPNRIIEWATQIDSLYSFQFINFDLEKKCLPQLDIFLEMCKRIDSFELDSYLVRRNLFSHLISYWGDYLSKNSTELIFFTTTPHEVVDYCLYLVAKALDIEIIMLQDVHLFSRKIASNTLESPWKPCFGNTSFPITSHNFKEILNSHHINYSPPWMPSNLGKKTDEMFKSKYSFRFLFRTFRCQMSLASIQIRKLLGIISTQVAISESNGELRKLRDSLLFQTRINTQSALALKRASLTSELPTSRYVLYCMNLDPEMMVNPLGAPFSSQIHAIAKLRELLPEEICIVVREHPLQYQLDSSYGVLGRSIDFYEKVHSIRNTIVSTPSKSLFSLVNEAEMVVTLNGTVGWQSAISGKKVALFGNSWIEGCPNTMRFRPDSTPNEMENWMKSEPNILQEDFLSFLKELFANSFEYISSSEIAQQLGATWDQDLNKQTFKEFVKLIL